MADLSGAYDFSLFEDRAMSALPVEDPQVRRERRQRGNIVELPQKELEKNRKPKHHPFRAALATLSFLVVFSTMVSIVYSQVRLTELTEDINQASQDLSEAKSREIQLSMEASEKMNGTEVEEYVKKQLGMSKITEGQVTYLNVTQEDKGTVVEDVEGASWLDQLLTAIADWFA